MDSDVAGVLGCLVGLVIMVGLIALAVYLVKKSNELSKRTQAMYAQLAQRLPQDKQGIFMMQYNNVKKDSTVAVLLAIFLGGIGAHKFYLGKVGLGFLYLIFAWTIIPGIVALIEAFTLPIQVNKYNQEKMKEIFTMLQGGHNAMLYQ